MSDDGALDGLHTPGSRGRGAGRSDEGRRIPEVLWKLSEGSVFTKDGVIR